MLPYILSTLTHRTLFTNLSGNTLARLFSNMREVVYLSRASLMFVPKSIFVSCTYFCKYTAL